MEIYVNSEETLLQNIKQIKAAQKKYSTYTQEQVDKIFKAVAMVANDHRIELAKMAQEETGMGIMEDKEKPVDEIGKVDTVQKAPEMDKNANEFL